MKVITNIKSRNTEAYEVELGHRTLLIGPNESGKSAIAEAVELALTGNVSGILFRKNPVKQAHQLGALCPAGATDPLFAQVEFGGDGGAVRWEGGKRELLSGEASVLNTTVALVAELRAVLSGSSNTVYEYFYNKLVKGDAVKNWKKAGAKRRATRTKITANDALIKELAQARELESDEGTDMLNTFVKSVVISHVKRHKAELGSVAKLIFKTIGSVGELSKIPGSATVWDDLEYRIQAHALFEIAARSAVNISSLTDEYNTVTEEEADLLAIMKADTNIALKDYCTQVSRYLPPGEKFRLTEISGMLQCGIERKAKVYYALSGSTEARILAAMGAALGSSAHSVVIVDDRMWDSTTMASTMKALEKSPCRVIMMATSKPRGRARKGWTYIDMDSIHEVVDNDSNDDSKLIIEVDFGAA